MDSGNSGSVSSSGDEEYDSVPASFLNPHAQIGCFTSYPHSSLVSPSSHHHQIQTHHPYVFDVSPTYLQPNSNPNIPLLNLEAAPPRSDQPPNCTVPAVSSASASASASASSLQLRHEYDIMNNNAGGSAAGVSGSQSARNPKKRTRASRRAPTTVLTTDTSNFRAMVQEFTGIPAPPFSSSSYSRRLDLLAASSSFRSSSSSSSSFYPLRPSPHKLPSNNPSLLSSSPSTLLPNHNMGDANLASTTTTYANNSSPSIVNYQLIPNTDHVGVGGGVPFNHPQHMLSMQVLPFQTPISLHPFPNSLPASGFNPKSQSQPSLSIPSLEDQLGLGMRHPQPHLDLVTSHTHAHLSTSEADQPTPLTTTTPHAQAPTDHPFTSFPPATCKLINFSASSSSSTFNLDNNNNNNNLDNSSARGEGNH